MTRRRWDWAEVEEREREAELRLRDLEDELALRTEPAVRFVSEYEPGDDAWHGMATHEREEEEHGRR